MEIKCQICSKSSVVREWNKNTLENCMTRVQKRAFKSIENNKRRNSSYYKCPYCSKWLRGDQLIYSDNPNVYSKIIKTIKKTSNSNGV